MDFLTIAGCIIALFIFYKIGHAQGQFYCMKKMGTRVAVLYASKGQVDSGFTFAENHVLTRTKKDESQVPVKIIYEVNNG